MSEETKQLIVRLKERTHRLRRAAQCWDRCGSVECSAIYHGAATELEILIQELQKGFE